MNFTSQPSGIVGANSPMIYQAYDSLYASAGFEYRFKIYVWSGTATIPASPRVEIVKLPDQYGGGRAWIDAHKIALQYLSTENLQAGQYKTTIGSGAVYVAVKVQGVYNAGTTAEISSNIVLATQGYHYTSAGFNPSFSNKIFMDQTTLILTTSTQEAYIYYDASYYSLISSGTESFAPTAVSTSSNRIQGVNIKTLMTNGGTWGTNGNISFTRAGGIDTIAIQFVCQNKYGQTDLHFLNRFGTWESFTFNSLFRQSVDRKSEDYSKPVYRSATLSTAWSYGVQISNRFNTETTEKISIQSDWISESYVTTMEQIMQSDMILLIESGAFYSALISDKSFQIKTASVDRLIQYGFTLEYAQPKINTIVR